MKNQIELQQKNGPRRGSHLQTGAQGEKPRTSSVIAADFQYLRQKMANDTAAQKSRKTSRMSKGLNPDAPRKKNHQPQLPPKDEKQADQKKKDAKASQISGMDQHRIPLQELLYRFGANLQNGLTTQMAIKRNLEEGDNKLPQKKKTPAWIRFLKEITNWFAIMLWVGSILSIITYILQPTGNEPNLILGCVLIFVIILTGVITFAQGAKSQALMDGFKNMMPSVTKCLRDGKITQIPAEKLVRGDIVEIISGQKIPADLRILTSIEMKVDNSALTGEVEPLLRSPECTHPNEPFETKNIAFFGTLCKQGRGRGIVIQIADKTVMGQIADLASTGGGQKSPLRVQLDRFVLIITVIALVLAVLFFFLSRFVVNYPWLECIIFAIGILVANVPEGLLACITISLAITAKKLSEKQVLVKNLEAVETLGSTSCICSDKTGTLTQNKMTVQNLWYDGVVIRGHSKQVKGADFEYEYDIQDPSFKVLHHTAMICSEAKFDVKQEDLRDPAFKYMNASVIGDASQTALIKFYQTIQDIGKTRSLYPYGRTKDNQQSKMPFNSTNKYALSIVRQQGPDHHYVAYIKGAPQKVWKYCNRMLFEGKYKMIDSEQKKKFEEVNLRFGKNGQRVLGFAMLPLNKQVFHQNFQFNTSTPDNFNFPIENYIFVGLISLMDPPKQSVPFAIKKCQSAGIKVIMVTGDQPPTAAAIAKQIGIITLKTNQDLKQQGYTAQQALQKANAIVIHGDMIVKAYEESQQQGDQILSQWCNKPQIVFARTTPAQKLLIVKANQNLGHVVGVTGDGVNDSPAIKQGDIGISMGISGSDVTKDAADMILLNDDFSSIIDGVQEGRKIFDNLKKTVVYLLTSNMTQIWPFAGLVILQIPLPLSNIFMLVICVGTDIYPALSLAYQEAEVDIMTRRPRKKDEHLVSGRLLAHSYGQMGQIATASAFFTYFTIMDIYGFSSTTLFFLLSNPVLLPIDTTINAVQNAQQIYVYTYTNPNNVNFQYYFDGNDTTTLSNGTGYFNTSSIASPKYTCDPANKGNAFTTNFPNWLSTINGQLDLRGLYVQCQNNTDINGSQYYSYNRFIPTQPTLNTISSYLGTPVAYTTEALYYAQSGYFITVVMVQWSNVFACKSRKCSLIYSGVNRHMFGGVALQTCLFILLCYCPGINGVFGGRQLQFWLMGLPGILSSMLLLCWQQSRKMLLNMDSNHGNENWWVKNLLW